MSTRLTVALDGIAVDIRSEVPGVVPWLREALVPGFAVVAPGAFVDEPAPLRVCIAAAPRTNEPLSPASELPCFALDGEVANLPGRRCGGTVTLEDQGWATRYEIVPTGVRISPLRPGARLRVAAFRVVREMATVRALALGEREQLHAACVAWEGRSLLLAGPKRAGKTTLLTTLAASTGAGIVANDRALLRSTQDGWHVTGIPAVVGVRPGTMRRLPTLFKGVPAVRRPVDLTVREAEDAAVRQGTLQSPSLVYLSPPQFAREVGSRVVPGARLASVAVISLNSDAEDFRIRRMSRAEAVRALDQVRFGSRSSSASPTVFECAFGRGVVPDPSRPPHPELAEARWMAVEIGERFTDSGSAPERLLRALSGHGQG